MSIRILVGDCRVVLATLPAASVHCIVTSPPYFGLRDYGVAGQIGLEQTPDAYIAELVAVFREARRVLRDDGTLWLNLGDSYAATTSTASNAPSAKSTLTTNGGRGPLPGDKYHYANAAKGRRLQPNCKPKDLLMIPAQVALALRADGWFLRSHIIWHKPNPMPESVTDRPTSAHESIFLLSKSARYFYDADAVREAAVCAGDADRELARDRIDRGGDLRGRKRRAGGGGDGRNLRNVWSVATQPFSWGKETFRQVRVEADAEVDGKKRKASPDCPVHGDRGRLATNDPGGGHEAAGQTRKSSNGLHHAPEQLDGSAPIDRKPARETAAQSSGLPLPSCSPSARDHSIGSHRRGLDPETSLACSASAQTSPRTDGTPATILSSERHLGTPESNNVAADSADNPSSRTQDGTADTSLGSVSSSASSSLDCSCEYYIEIASKVEHFATFPPNLIEPCIKAGTSEKGCCAKCGAPWKREVERAAISVRPNFDGMRGLLPKSHKRGEAGGDAIDRCGNSASTTLGWSLSCSCDASLVPCTVLDPFGGAGTTALVADRLQRNSILIELNAAYASMAEERIAIDAGILNSGIQVEVAA